MSVKAWCQQEGYSCKTYYRWERKEPVLISGSYASPEAAAHIAIQKFKMGSPLYRQEQEWNAADIMISRQTMSNRPVRCSIEWCAPIYNERWQEMIKQHDLLHADETEVQVLREPGRTPQSKSYSTPAAGPTTAIPNSTDFVIEPLLNCIM